VQSRQPVRASSGELFFQASIKSKPYRILSKYKVINTYKVFTQVFSSMEGFHL